MAVTTFANPKTLKLPNLIINFLKEVEQSNVAGFGKDSYKQDAAQVKAILSNKTIDEIYQIYLAIEDYLRQLAETLLEFSAIK